jgi:hypothetical protein
MGSTTNESVINWSIFLPVLTTSITIISSIIIWAITERNKRRQELYYRKEEKYSQLIKSIKGFTIDQDSRQLKSEFLNQLDLCWMYCPDSVIKIAYKFLSMLNPERSKEPNQEELKEKISELVLAIRKDLLNNKNLKKTELTSKDYKILKVK